MLELKGITKSYIKNNNKTTILKDITYKFEENKFYAIMGKSGAGKTTLIQILGLLDSIDIGDYFINNNKINDLSENKKAEIRALNIGFIFQSFYLNPNLTALENVILPLYIKNTLSYNEKIELGKKLLKKMGLKDRMNYFSRELSGGECQRVAIARSLINNPNIILADEPTGSLDKENELLILDILKKLSQNNKCVIVVTHNEKVLEYADKILRIKDGNLYEE